MIRDINTVDDYIITAKREIKIKLYNDPDIIEALANPDLNPEEPDTYVGRNIFPYIRLPGTLKNKENYICFDIQRDSFAQYNKVISNLYFVINVYAHEDTIETPYGIERHDLLGYLVRDIFNYSNFMGTQLVLKSDKPGIMDAYYSSRSLMFLVQTHNELQNHLTTNKYEMDLIRG